MLANSVAMLFTTLKSAILSFVRPHLDYGFVIYDQLSNATFSKKIESVQYNAALAITDVIRGSFREKLYQKLGLQYLHHRRWIRCFCLL